VRDIYQWKLRPGATEQRLMRQSYGATVVLALTAVILALFVPSIDAIWRWITGPLSAGLFAPIILRWYWWRLNGWGFAVATAVGLLCSIGLELAGGLPLYLAFPLTWAAALAAGVATSYLTAPTPLGTLQTFWQRIRPFGLWRPVTQELASEQVQAAHQEHRRDLLATPLAVGWHVSGVVAVIALLLHKWTTLVLAAAAFALLGLLLHRVWYRTLGRA
jgi:Na+/proline symporter